MDTVYDFFLKNFIAYKLFCGKCSINLIITLKQVLLIKSLTKI